MTRAGHAEYKRLVKLCKEARAKPETADFEKAFLEDYRVRKGITAPSIDEQNKAKRRKTNEDVAQESEESDGEEEFDDESEEEDC